MSEAIAEPVAPVVPAEKVKKKRLKKAKVVDIKDLYPKQFEGITPPQSLWRSRVIGTQVTKDRRDNDVIGVQHVCGVGAKPAEVMFISPCLLIEETYKNYSTQPTMLNGPAGSMFRRSLERRSKSEANDARKVSHLPGMDCQIMALNPKEVL